ncbi:MAG TPA: hypothetical protein VGN16_13395 [Acidobacteriaceae bacterium]|jgi:hypothetical protein
MARSLRALVLLAPFCAWPSAWCQKSATPPTLGELLRSLDSNLNRFDTSVPSFFCDEHVLSAVESDTDNRKTVTDAVFRLQRVSGPDHSTTLVESHEIRTVNGKPAASQHIEGPSLLKGAFEGLLSVVSSSQRSCMRYELGAMDSKHPGGPAGIRFSTALTPENTESCFLQEKSKGRVLIDPASMQITHLEIQTPRHIIFPGVRPVTGERILTVDYAPVSLDGETFWMPSSITMQVTAGQGTFHKTFWSFQAAYANFHRMKVTSHIVPGGGTAIR